MDASKPVTLEQPALANASSGEAVEVTLLVDRAKGGDAGAFSDLMRLYEHRIISLGLQMGLPREDALDACQDAFVKVFRYIGRFRSGQSFYKWLYRIAIHAIYDHMKRHRRPGMVSMEDLEAGQLSRLRDQATPADLAVESADLSRRLMQGLDGLSRQEKIVFVMRDMQEMPAGDIGRILGISQVTIRRHCMSARQKLRRYVYGRKP
jgi:RNA polymerase sigma-70 factor (ECF subfamily)